MKVLIHPGYPSGAFRLEQIKTRKELISNTKMGYKPSINQLHHLQLTAKKIENEQVKCSMIIRSEKNKRFEKSIILEKTTSVTLTKSA